MSENPEPTSFARDPGRLATLARDVANRTRSPVDLVTACLARIDDVEPAVKAWRVVDGDRALALAKIREDEATRGLIRGPLHGIPVAIKDIIDVEGLPTRCNSVSRSNVAPSTMDAEIVLALKAQGAIVLGKVHTTEFAFFDPSPACNPHNVTHTPGGSSSGSAAAVAAGMVPLSIGTQTVASVNRPAAYCGIAAFKPSTKSVSSFGIAPLGPSYDTPGFFGWSAADAVYAYQAVAPAFFPASPRSAGKPTVAFLEDPHLSDATAEAMAAVAQLRSKLSNSGIRVTTLAAPIDFKRLFEIQRTTMLYEAGRAMHAFTTLPDGQIGQKLLDALGQGLKISQQQYFNERREIDAMRHTFLAATLEIDAYIWPAAPGAAPKGLDWTGDPKYIAPWTAIGGPILSVPTAVTAGGLPLGCIVCGKPGADAAIAEFSRQYIT